VVALTVTFSVRRNERGSLVKRLSAAVVDDKRKAPFALSNDSAERMCKGKPLRHPHSENATN